MKIHLHLILFIFCSIFFSLAGQAQFISKSIVVGDTTQVHVLKTENGDRFVGQVTKIENTTIYFLFRGDSVLEFNLSEISSIALANEAISNDTGGQSQNRSEAYQRAQRAYEEKNSGPVELTGDENLFFAPSAFTYGKGKGEYRTTMVLYNRIDYGVTDNIDIGLDLMPLIGFNLLALRGKVGLPVSENLNVGFGATLYTAVVPFDFNDNVMGATHTYGITTIGNKDKFITVSYGYAFPFDKERENAASTLSIGGSLRVGKSWKLITDLNFIGSVESPEFYSFGTSWFKGRNRFDFGITVLGFDDFRDNRIFLPIPFATYALSFGDK